jgi:hypothetical protein
MYATGRLVDATHSFNTAFVLAGVLPITGYAAFSLLAGRIRRLD